MISNAHAENQDPEFNILYHESPLKQLESGISIQNIHCEQGYLLVIRESKGDPACIFSSVSSRLLAHGWVTLEKFMAVHPNTLQQNETNELIQNQTSTSQSTTNINETYRWISGCYFYNWKGISPPSSLHCDPISAWASPGFQPLNIRPTIIGTSMFSPTAGHETCDTRCLDSYGSGSAIVPDRIPNVVEILYMGMRNQPLKVGDNLELSVTFKNISNMTIRAGMGPCFSSFYYAVYPTTSVTGEPRNCESMRIPVTIVKVESDQIMTLPSQGNYIVKSDGNLHIIGVLNLQQEKTGYPYGKQINEIFSFDINATQ